MKKINALKLKAFLRYHVKFSIYEIALAGIFVALWTVSALPIFNFNLGFMHIGITYVWPILLGLTAKPVMAIMCAIIGDNIALLSSGTGFGQWMIEYAVIAPAIAIISLLFKKLIVSQKELTWWIMVVLLNVTVLVGTLVTMIVEDNFKYASKNVSDRVFDFTDQTAKIVVWTMYAVITLFFALLIVIYLISNKKQEIKIGSRIMKLNKNSIRQLISFYSLSMVIIVITIWLWGPFAQIRYLNLYGSVSKPHAYSEYDLFLIPRILKTPISLALYTAIVLPIYKTHEHVAKRIGQENKW